MRTPSSKECRLDLAPPLADRFIFGFPIDYGPVLLLMPFRFHLTMDTLPSEVLQWLQVGLGCIQLSPLCPFRRLHTFCFLRPARFYPRFRIWRSSFERQRDFNPPEQRVAQHAFLTRKASSSSASHRFIPAGLSRRTDFHPQAVEHVRHTIKRPVLDQTGLKDRYVVAPRRTNPFTT